MEFVHVLAILTALLTGVYTGTLGWKRYQFRKGRADASGFDWQKHIRWGRRFYLLLWLGFIMGFVSMYIERGKVFGTGLHAYLAILILSLFSVGVYLGVRLSRRKGLGSPCSRSYGRQLHHLFLRSFSGHSGGDPTDPFLKGLKEKTRFDFTRDGGD